MKYWDKGSKGSVSSLSKRESSHTNGKGLTGHEPIEPVIPEILRPKHTVNMFWHCESGIHVPPRPETVVFINAIYFITITDNYSTICILNKIKYAFKFRVLLLGPPLSIAGPPIFVATPPFIQTSAGSRYLDCTKQPRCRRYIELVAYKSI